MISSGSKNTLFLVAAMAVTVFVLFGLAMASDDSDAAEVASGVVTSDGQQIGTWTLDDTGILAVGTDSGESEAVDFILEGISPYYSSVKTVELSGFVKDVTALFSGQYSNLEHLYYVGSNTSPTNFKWQYEPRTWTLTVNTTVNSSLYFSKPEFADAPVIPWSGYYFYPELKTAVITGTATELSSYVFYGCTSLTTLTADNITSITGKWVFKGTSISVVNMPKLMKICHFHDAENNEYITSFTGTGIQQVNTPLLNELQNNAFRDCTQLSEIKIASDSVKLFVNAFRGCTALKYLDVTGIVRADNNAFTDSGIIGMPTAMGYPAGKFLFNSLTTVNTWNQSPFYNWLGVRDIEIPQLTTSNHLALFNGCANLVSVKFSPELESLGDSTFVGCTSLVSMELPDKLTTISSSMFRDCTALRTVVIGNAVDTIGTYAFSGCTLLESVTQRGAVSPSSQTVTTMNSYAFDNCKVLTEVPIYNTSTFGNYVLRGCHGITTLDIGNLDTHLSAKINNYAFQNCLNLTSLNIGIGVTELGEVICHGCNELRTVTIGDGVKKMYNTFPSLVNLTTVNMGANIEDIGNSSFNNCASLSSIDIPASVTRIGSSAFNNCGSLATVTFHEGLELIEASAFYNCVLLEDVSLPDSVQEVRTSAFYYCSKVKTLDLGSGLTVIGDNAFRRMSFFKGSVTIPAGVTEIGSCAFEGTGLTEIVLNSGLTKIKSSAFEASGLNTVVKIPDTVEIIEHHAFNNCQMTGVEFGPSSLVREIANSAFDSCKKLTGTVYLPAKLETIGHHAFSNCLQLSQLQLAEESVLQSLGYYAFYNCSQMTGTITIPDTVLNLERYTFYNCKQLESVTIRETSKMTEIGEWAFYNTPNLKCPMVIPQGVISVGEYAFHTSGITSLKILATLTEIKKATFYNCAELETLEWPEVSSVVTIQDEAFGYDRKLTIDAMHFDNLTSLGRRAFFYAANHVRELTFGVLEEIPYQAFYNESTSIITELETVSGPNLLVIGEGAFRAHKSLTTLELPKVTDLEKYAFSYPSSLQHLSLPSAVNIGVECFYNPVELLDVQLDAAVDIGNHAFNSCGKLKTVNAPFVEHIGKSAFYYCTTLTELNIPSVKVVEDSAFQECDRVQNLNLPVVTSIGYLSFYNMNDLVTVNMPKIQEIGNRAFDYCGKLTGEYVFNDLLSIGSQAFRSSGIEKFSAPNVQTVGNEAFISNGKLTELRLDAAETVSSTVFASCSKLEVISFNGATAMDSGIFSPLKYLRELSLNSLIDVNAELFKRCYALETVSISSAKTIGARAFQDCILIETVSMPEVVRIGDSAFTGCQALTTIDIHSVVDIGANAFSGDTALSGVIDIRGVSSIGDSAFKNCSGISSFNFGPTFRDLGTQVFFGCTSVVSYDVSGTNNYYQSRDGVLFSNNVSILVNYPAKRISVTYEIPETVTVIKAYAFASSRTLETLTFPSAQTLDIEDHAFYMSAIQGKLTIPSVVHSIGYMAFADCTGLTDLVIEASAVDLFQREGSDSFAFDNCTSLQTLSIPVSVENAKVFRGNSQLSSYTFTPSVNKLPDGYYETNYQDTPWYTNVVPRIEVTFASGVSSVDSFMFKVRNTGDAYNNLYKVTMSDSITTVGDAAFFNCSKMEYLTIGDNVTSLGADCLYECNGIRELTVPITLNMGIVEDGSPKMRYIQNLTLTKGFNGMGYDYDAFTYSNTVWQSSMNYSVTIADGVISIGDYIHLMPGNAMVFPKSVRTVGIEAFTNSGLPSVTLNEGLSEIRDSAFAGCISLSALSLPSSLRVIGEDPFYGCTRLTDLTLPISLNVSSVFGDCSQLANYTFLKGSGDGFDYDSDPSADNSVVNTPWYLSRDTIAINVTFADGIRSIGTNMFYECGTNVGMPYGISGVVKFPNSLKTIDENAFNGCLAVKDFQFGTGLNNIGESAFALCTGIKSLTLSDSASNVGGHAFYGCTGITTLKMPISMNSVSSSTMPIFDGCTGIKEIYLGGTKDGYNYDNIEGSDSYYQYTPWYQSRGNSISITLDKKIPSVGNYTFYKCTGMAGTLTIPYNITAIGDYAFYGCTKISDLVVENGTLLFGKSAFGDSTGIKTLTIPINLDVVRSVNNPVFQGCTNITSFVFTGSANGINYGTDQTQSSYYQLTPWYVSKDKSMTVKFSDEITTIGSYMFYECNGLRGDVTAKGVTHISKFAFAGSSIAKFNGEQTIAIDESAFEGCKKLTSMDLPLLLTVGNKAMYGCTNLVTVTMPKCNTLGNSVFELSGVKRINSPDRIDLSSVRNMGTRVFADSGAVNVTMGDLKTMGDYAFMNCKYLNEVRFNGTVDTIPMNTFLVTGEGAVSPLTAIYANKVENFAADLSDSFPNLQTVELRTVLHLGSDSGDTVGMFMNCTGLKNVVLNDTTTISLPKYAFKGCTALETMDLSKVNLTQESEFEGCILLNGINLDTCVTISKAAFKGCTSLQNLTANIATRIGVEAFVESGIVNVNDSMFPRLIQIESRAFDGSQSLQTVDLSKASIAGEYAFSGCSVLKTVSMPELTIASKGLFYNCSDLVSTDFSSVSTISELAFFNCKDLVEIDLPAVEAIGSIPSGTPGTDDYKEYSVFGNCVKLQRVGMPEIRSIGATAFYNCNKLVGINNDGSQYILPDVEEIGYGAFAESGAVSVTVGKMGGIAEIGDYAFYACKTLMSFASPSLMTLPLHLFSNGDMEKASEVLALETVNVPAVVYFYADLHGSGNLRTVNMPSATEFSDNLFNGCGLLKDVTTMNEPGRGNVVKLSNYMFANCGQLTKVEFTNAELGQDKVGTFSGCRMLKTVSLPSSQYISAEAFKGCDKLDSVNLPEVKEIKADAFVGCTALVAVSAPRLVKVGDRAFKGCTKMTKFNSDIGDIYSTEMELSVSHKVNPFIAIETIGKESFMGCVFEELVLGPSTVSVGESAFADNKSLKTLVTPNSLITISPKTFQGCPLEEVHIASSISEIGINAFDYTGVTIKKASFWFNGPVEKIRFSLDSILANPSMTMVLNVDLNSLETISDDIDAGYITGTANMSFSGQSYSKVVLQGAGTTEVAAIYGGRVVLPRVNNLKYFGFYALRDNAGLLLSLFSDENAYIKGNVAKTGDSVPVYPLGEGGTMRFVGYDTVTPSFDNSVKVVTSAFGLPSNPETQMVHYGGILKVPSFIDPSMKLKTIKVVNTNGAEFEIPVDTVSLRVGYRFKEIQLHSEESKVLVTFISKGISYDKEVILQSPFSEVEGLDEYTVPEPGYTFVGWFGSPTDRDDPALPSTPMIAGAKWYAHFDPKEYHVRLFSTNEETVFEKELSLFGPYKFLEKDGSLYYRDANHAVDTLVFAANEVTGYTVDVFIDKEASKAISGSYDVLTRDVNIEVFFTMSKYDLTLKFVDEEGAELGSEIIFRIDDWKIGQGVTDFHNNSVISDIDYTVIKDGLLLPVPLNNQYALSGIYAGDTPIKYEDGYTLTVDMFKGGVSLVLTYKVEKGLYNVTFKFNDDADTVRDYYKTLHYDTETKTGDKFMTQPISKENSKVGYKFVGWKINGMAGEPWPMNHTLELTAEMITYAVDCRITIVGVWESYKYTINYDLGDFTGTKDPMANVAVGDEMIFTPVDGYTGYKITGWYWVRGEEKSATYTLDPDGSLSILLEQELISKYATGMELTIKAVWGERSYTLTVDPDCPVKTFRDIPDVKFGSQFQLWDVGTYTQAFKKFDGWNVAGTVYDNMSTVTLNEAMAKEGDASADGKIIVYLSWVDLEYQVQYDLNGGDGVSPIDNKVYKVGDPFVMAVDDGRFYREGYTFAGWKYSKDAYAPYENEGEDFDKVLAQSANEAGLVTLYAVWNELSYKIAYSLDGGRAGNNAPTSVIYGNEVKVSNPLRTGYDFIGWTAEGLTGGALYSSSHGYNRWDGNKVVTSETFMNLCSEDGGTVTMIAHWAQATYTVSYSLNGGNGKIVGGQSQIQIGDRIEVPQLKDAYRMGYNFAGWSIDRVNVIDNGTPLTIDMILSDEGSTIMFYAVWNPIQYNLSYRYMSDYSYTTLSVAYEESVLVPSLDRPGYKFAGWAIGGMSSTNAFYSNDGETWYKLTSDVVNAKYFKNLSVNDKGNVKLDAIWTTTQYRIVYNANGGVGQVPIDSNVYVVGDKITMLSFDSLIGTNGNKAVVGWSLDRDGSQTVLTEFTEGLAQKADATNAVNLYAVWIDGMCSVTVDLGGGSPNIVPAGWFLNDDGLYEKLFDYGTTMKNVMSDWETIDIGKDGYKFVGWTYGSGTLTSNTEVTANYDEVSTIVVPAIGAVVGMLLILGLLVSRFQR